MLALKRGTALVIGLAFAVLAIVEFFYLPNRSEAMQLEALRAKAVALSELTAYGVASSLEFDAEEAAMEQLEGPARDRDLSVIVLYTSEGKTFAALNRSADVAPAAPAVPSRTETSALPSRLRVVTPIPLRSGPPGVLVADFSTLEIELAAVKNRRAAGGIALAILGLGVVLVIWIRRAMRRIERLLEENSRARERAEAANQAKSEFLANTSHEIRTPLNAVLGTVEVLLAHELPPKQRKLSETIQRGGRSLLALLDDVLDFSKIESGKLTLESVPIDTRSLVGDVVDRFASPAASKGLELELRIDPDVPNALVGDGHRLEQVLNNLIGNAVKFTDRGHVHVRVQQLARGADSVRLRFGVADTGIGISPETVARLGTAFSQADSSTTRVYGGSGLGLAISRRLVAMMGGNGGVETELGKGSHFWFDLELPLSEAPATGEPASHVEPEQARPVRVFAAEDNAANQEVLRAMLELLGCDVTIGDDGRAAVEALRTTTEFDLVLMDCQMPVLDGYQATREIRREEERSGRTRVPIVAVTAHALAGEREKVVAAGMDDYVTKPLSMSALRAAIARWSPSASLRPAPHPSSPGLVSRTPVLELETVEQLRSYATPRKPRFFVDVVGKYTSAAHSDLETIRVAIDGGDRETVRGRAHALKGSSRTIGAAEVARLAERLEALTKEVEAPLAPTFVELESALARASSALNAAAAA